MAAFKYVGVNRDGSTFDADELRRRLPPDKRPLVAPELVRIDEHLGYGDERLIRTIWRVN